MNEVAELVAQEIGLMRRLIEQLEAERLALLAANSDDIEAIAREKLRLTEAINQAEFSRCAALGLPPERVAIADWGNRLADGDPLKPAWRQLMVLVREARKLHQRNGSLLDALATQTGQSLEVLRRLHRGPALYGSDGQSERANNSRIVDSA